MNRNALSEITCEEGFTKVGEPTQIFYRCYQKTTDRRNIDPFEEAVQKAAKKEAKYYLILDNAEPETLSSDIEKGELCENVQYFK